MPLKQYIKENFQSLSAFARVCDVLPQQVTKWINMECIVINGKLYSPRRDIPQSSNEKSPELLTQGFNE